MDTSPYYTFQDDESHHPTVPLLVDVPPPSPNYTLSVEGVKMTTSAPSFAQLHIDTCGKIVKTIIIFCVGAIVLLIGNEMWTTRGETAPCSITAATIEEMCGRGQYETFCYSAECSYISTTNCRQTGKVCRGGSNACYSSEWECCAKDSWGINENLPDDWVPYLEVTLHWSTADAVYTNTIDLSKDLETGKRLGTRRIAELYADSLVGRNGTCYYNPDTLDAPDLRRAVWD